MMHQVLWCAFNWISMMYTYRYPLHRFASNRSINRHYSTKSSSSGSSSNDSYSTNLSYVSYPARQCLEALSVGDVEDDDDALSLAIEGGGHRSKPFLTSGVPYLRMHACNWIDDEGLSVIHDVFLPYNVRTNYMVKAINHDYWHQLQSINISSITWLHYIIKPVS